MGNGTPYCEEEDAIIIAAFNDGCTDREIVTQLSDAGFPERTGKQITNHRKVLGLRHASGNDKVFSEAEDAIIRDGFNAKRFDREIGATLCAAGFQRTGASVGARRKKLGLMVHETMQNQAHVVSGAPAREEYDDRRFQAAMQRAISAGRENARVGIIKDDRPFPVTRFQPASALHSGCGSSAALCAEG